MNIIGIIPVRMASSRLPGKPLAEINSVPMLGHVYHRSALSSTLKKVYIAGCDQELKEYAESIQAPYIETMDTHERCSDRTAEAVEKIETETGEKIDIVVMIQGDEPMISPEMVDAALEPFQEDERIQVVNLMASLRSREEHEDPNEPKVVVDQNNFALYFSREPIPSRKKGATEVPMQKQVCIIPFRRDFLATFNSLPPTPLEEIESIDMLRILEHGYKVKMVSSSFPTYSVDTQEDLDKVRTLMKNDELVKKYA